MKILYVVYKSPLTSDPLRKALAIAERHASSGFKVSILLLADAVITATSTIMRKQLEDLKRLGVQIYVLRDDVEARGLLIDGAIARQVSYSEVVDLIEEHDKVITWS